ncbi:MAG: hypothetical protein HQL62_03810 [Magnetococcales bacterium]|nr:hypothetical protein [Magnetococcales bacterium]
MESRKQRFKDQEDVLPLLRARMEKMVGKGGVLGGAHVFTPGSDIPDEYGSGPRLVVLTPSVSYHKGHKGPANAALVAAGEILRKRGDQPRQKQNRILFLAADYDVVSRVWDQGRNYLAWNSIVLDIEKERIVLNTIQVRQAKEQKKEAEQSLQRLLREAYRWLINPHEKFVLGKPILEWEVVAISPTAPDLTKAIEEKSVAEEWLIKEWSPIHLGHVLRQWYFRAGMTEVSALKVWQDTCHYLYLPRMVNDDVFKKVMTQGVASRDFFGYATGIERERYPGFVFGQSGPTPLDASAILIERETATRYQEKLRQEQETEKQKKNGNASPNGDDKNHAITPSVAGPSRSGGASGQPGQPLAQQPTVKKHFYGTVNLDPIKAKIDFATIVDEVVQLFTSRMGMEVKISIEIQATGKGGFDAAIQRTIKENCNVLRFVSAEFD